MKGKGLLDLKQWSALFVLFPVLRESLPFALSSYLLAWSDRPGWAANED